ncbi:MAG: ubiquinol-cytochrome c reductase iron-sulfur subunit [Candidatus Bathyarchaeia archaeon]
MAALRRWIWPALAVILTAVGIAAFIYSQSYPSPSLLYGYARVLGWSGLISAAVLVVQGFWKASRDRQYMDGLRNSLTNAKHEVIAKKYTEARVYGWRTAHIALSILLTVIAGVHGILLFPLTYSPTPGILLGIGGLLLLLILGVSGIITEMNRKTKTFSLMKKAHLWLMVISLALIELHAITSDTAIAQMGPAVSLDLFLGTIGLIGVGVFYATIKGTKTLFRLLSPNIAQNQSPTDLARRNALQKLSTIAAGTLVALTFAELSTLAPRLLPILQNQQTQSIIHAQSTTSVQSNAQVTQFNSQTTGIKLGNLANIPNNSAFYFNDSQGNPDILIRLQNGNVVAFSSTCTHRPCTVGYDTNSGLIQCPCHGAVFDPSQGAAVLQGPAPTPLPTVQLTIDSNGNIWLP